MEKFVSVLGMRCDAGCLGLGVGAGASLVLVFVLVSLCRHLAAVSLGRRLSRVCGLCMYLGLGLCLDIGFGVDFSLSLGFSIGVDIVLSLGLDQGLGLYVSNSVQFPSPRHFSFGRSLGPRLSADLCFGFSLCLCGHTKQN